MRTHATPLGGGFHVRVEVYLGGATRSGTLLDAGCYAGWVRRVADALADESGGGATVHPAGVGYWRGQAEPSTRVEAFVPQDAASRFLAHPIWCNFLAATNQDAVLVVVDGVPWLVQDDDTAQER